jgi:AraC-like DNA-binding protein
VFKAVGVALPAAIGVSERTLRACCHEFLGMSACRYLLLRRLNRVRRELLHSDPATTRIADQARRHGFTELGRFAVVYRTVFGETPSSTLRNAPG